MDIQESIFEVTPQTFQKEVVERSRSTPVVVLFWTDQVAPSVETRQSLEKLAQEYQGKFALALSDVAKDQLIAQQLRIQGIPSIRVIVDGSIADQLEGPQGETPLRALLDRFTMSTGERLQSSLEEVIELGDWEQAMSILQEALREEPNNPKYKVEWADVLVCKGEPEQARKVLSTISDDETEKRRPVTRLELHEEAAALRSMQELDREVEANSSDLDARYELAIQLASARRYSEALEHLMFILQTDRTYRDDIGRAAMVRVMSLMSKNSPIAKQYRRRMFNYMH